MGTPYRATKDHNATPGMPFDAKEGDVAYLEGRPPAGWEPVEVDLTAGLLDVENAAQEGADAVANLEDAAAGAKSADGPQRPAASALTPPWQEYLVALGVPAEEAAALTKEQLVARADEREAELEAETEAAKKAAEEAAAKDSGGK